MAVAFIDQTLGEVFVSVAELTGDLLNQGTLTAGATTSGTDATNERTPTDQSRLVTGSYLYFPEGTAAGDEHELTTYSTIGVMAWAVAGTAPDDTTTWARVKRRPRRILDAIDQATRDAARTHAIAYPFEGIITNNLLGYYLSGQEWDAGNTSAPTGATLASATIARQTSEALIGFGRYGGRLTGSGAVGTLTRVVPPYLVRLLRGKSLTLKGRIAETTAADGVVRVTSTDTANSATNTDRTGTYTSDIWEELKDISTAAIALTDPAGELQVQIRAKDGTTVHYNSIYLGGGLYLRDYDLPPTMIGMKPIIKMESGFGLADYRYSYHFGRNFTTVPIDGAERRVLHMKQDMPFERHLEIQGFRAPDVVTSATADVEVNPGYLAAQAALILLGQDDPTPAVTARIAAVEKRLNAMPWQDRDPWGGQAIHWFEKPR